jgi:alkylhydroperoxidase family enzyme
VDAVLKSDPRSATPSLPANLAAVLRFTDAMTLDVRVPDDVFGELKKHFSEREVVEITATVGAYNCVSRVLVALDVGERNVMNGPSKGGVE